MNRDIRTLVHENKGKIQNELNEAQWSSLEAFCQNGAEESLDLGTIKEFLNILQGKIELCAHHKNSLSEALAKCGELEAEFSSSESSGLLTGY